jgi:hypothetical protein
MTWLLAYFLFGFAVAWIGTNILKIPTNPHGWRWELAATLLPLAHGRTGGEGARRQNVGQQRSGS